MSMDKRLVTWFWFSDSEIDRVTGRAAAPITFNKLLAERLRKAADELEKGPALNVSKGGNVSGAMGNPFGYFETTDEAKRYTK